MKTESSKSKLKSLKFRYLCIAIIVITIINGSIINGSSISNTNNLTNKSVFEYSDVKTTDWFYNPVTKLVNKGIISGYSDGTLKPNAFISKAEFVTILLKSMGYCEKVDNTVWYKNYILKAITLGIIEKQDSREYGRWVSTLHIPEMLCKILEIKPDTTGKTLYSDLKTEYKDIDTKWIDAAFRERIFIGYHYNGSRNFMPNTLTRAQAFELIASILDYKSDPESYREKANQSLLNVSEIPCKMFNYQGYDHNYPEQINEYMNKNKDIESQCFLKINNKAYVVIISGAMSSSGYSIVLRDAYVKEGVLTLVIRYLSPPSGVLCSITNPEAVIELDSSLQFNKINYIIEK